MILYDRKSKPNLTKKNEVQNIQNPKYRNQRKLKTVETQN